MSRSGKTRSAPARASGGSTLMGIFIGLLLGVLVALAVAWYVNRTPFPFQSKTGKNTPDRVEEAPRKNGPPLAANDGGGQKGQPPATAEPAALPGKPGDKPVSRFDFYKILPGESEAKPTTGSEAKKPEPKPESKAESKAETKPDEAKTAGGRMLLQVGSFQHSEDALALKARLALMGLDATVREADVPGKGLMHRVIVGPYTRPEDMSYVRSQLAMNGIQAAVVKQKDSRAE